MRAVVCEIELYIPAANSLKAKRQVLKSITERMKSRCNASVAETGRQDVWQRATVTVAIAGNTRVVLEQQLNVVRKIADDSSGAEVVAFNLEYV